MRVNNNLTGTHVNRLYMVNTRKIEKSIEKLTLGRRINRAVDDASGLAISEKLHSERRGLKQGIRNAQDGISLIQTVEGALGEMQNITHRMRELAVQAAHDLYVPEDRTEIQNELERLVEEIDRIALQTEFNTKSVLDGDEANLDLNIELGTAGKAGVFIVLSGMKSVDVGLMQNSEILVEGEHEYNERGFLDIQSATKASAAISAIDEATLKITGTRTNLGAIQNQLESVIANLSITAENLQASESGYRDLDMPSEVMLFTKEQIIGESINMLLVHANMNPQSIVPLLLR